MDDTIADFGGHPNFNGEKPNEISVSCMYEPGFFMSLKPIEGSQAAVRHLMRLGYDVQILSQPVAESAHSYSEKVQWIGVHFPDLIYKVHLTQNKGLFKGDYLIDDNPSKWKEKFEANGGKFVHFMYNSGNKSQLSNREMWERIVKFFTIHEVPNE